MTATVTDASAFTEKSLGKQVLYTIVTLGLYSIYWVYSTAKQLDQGTDASTTPILAIIPLLNLIVLWQISTAAEAVTDQGGLVLFLAFLVFAPISWYLIQAGMNEAAAG